jgi:hypothetical protein
MDEGDLDWGFAISAQIPQFLIELEVEIAS